MSRCSSCTAGANRSTHSSTTRSTSETRSLAAHPIRMLMSMSMSVLAISFRGLIRPCSAAKVLSQGSHRSQPTVQTVMQCAHTSTRAQCALIDACARKKTDRDSYPVGVADHKLILESPSPLRRRHESRETDCAHKAHRARIDHARAIGPAAAARFPAAGRSGPSPRPSPRRRRAPRGSRGRPA